MVIIIFARIGLWCAIGMKNGGGLGRISAYRVAWRVGRVVPRG